MNKQLGFSVSELGIVCVVVLLVGVLGYVFYDRWMDGVTGTEPVQVATVDDAPVISEAEDLTAAETALDEINLEDDSSLEELEAELVRFE